MWRFLTLAEPTIERVGDSNGRTGDVFIGPLLILGHYSRAGRQPITSVSDPHQHGRK